MYLITIKCNDHAAAAATCHRIEKVISMPRDTVIQNNLDILINTHFVGKFITKFYDDGFDNFMEIEYP